MPPTPRLGRAPPAFASKTNGKAERFIQTALREWAYAQAYPSSQRRAEELPVWLHRYNWHRPHGGIKSGTAPGVGVSMAPAPRRLEAPCQAKVSAAFIPQWNERRHVAVVR